MRLCFSSVLVASTIFSSANAAPLDVFRDCDTCPEMIELPMGSFLMGAPEDEFRRNLVDLGGFRRATLNDPYINEDEGPQVRVTVDIPIAMGRNEITYDEWMACVADGGCGGYVPNTEVGRQASAEAIVRSLVDEDFARSASGEIVAKAMAGEHFASFSTGYPVFRVSFHDAQRYVD